MQGLQDAQGRVQADQIKQLERTHREVASAAHRSIDIGSTRHAVLGQGDRRVQVGEEQGVDHEPGAVGDPDRLLAAVRREVLDGLDGALGRGHRLDHLDEGHRGRRIEEVEAAHPVGPSGRHRQLDHRQGGGVGGDHRGVSEHGVEFRHEVFLHLQVLDDGLDDEVAVGEVSQVLGGRDATHDLIRLSRIDSASLNGAVESSAHITGDPCGSLGGAGPHHDVETSGGDHLDDSGAHDARTDHAHP